MRSLTTQEILDGIEGSWNVYAHQAPEQGIAVLIPVLPGFEDAAKRARQSIRRHALVESAEWVFDTFATDPERMASQPSMPGWRVICRPYQEVVRG